MENFYENPTFVAMYEKFKKQAQKDFALNPDKARAISRDLEEKIKSPLYSGSLEVRAKRDAYSIAQEEDYLGKKAPAPEVRGYGKVKDYFFELD